MHHTNTYDRFNIQETHKKNIDWILYGIIYLACVMISNHPTVVEYFPTDGLSSTFVICPIVGATYMLRDVIQYSYEDTAEKRQKSSGFWPSMLFVILGAIITLGYGATSTAFASICAYILASTVDGISFSKKHKQPLSYRLLYSNIWGALTDTAVFTCIMIYLGRMTPNIMEHGLAAFMEISPALLIFFLDKSFILRPARLFKKLNQSVEGYVEKSNQQGWLNHMIFERIRLATVVLNRKGLVEHYNPAAQKLLGPIDLGRPIEILQSSHQNWAEAAQEYDHFPIYIQGQHQKLQGKVIDLNPEEEGLWLVFLEPYQAQDFTQA